MPEPSAIKGCQSPIRPASLSRARFEGIAKTLSLSLERVFARDPALKVYSVYWQRLGASDGFRQEVLACSPADAVRRAEAILGTALGENARFWTVASVRSMPEGLPTTTRRDRMEVLAAMILSAVAMVAYILLTARVPS